MPGLCVILALGTQEELNEHLLTKSRLKVIQDVRQKLFRISHLVRIVETETRGTYCSWTHPPTPPSTTGKKKILSFPEDAQVGFS